MADCKPSGYDNPTCFSQTSTGGVTGRVMLIEQAVWARMTRTQDADGVVTDLALGLQSGDQGWMYNLPRNSPKPTSPGAKGADGGGHVHTVPIVIPTLKQSEKNFVASLINRNLVVAIVENLDGISADDTDKAYWEVYGIQSYLEASVTDSQRANQDSGNGIMLTLSTPTDATLEFTLPVNVNDGVSRVTTNAIIEALETPVP